MCLAEECVADDLLPASQAPDQMRAKWLDASDVLPSQLQARWEHNLSITSETDVITAWCSFQSIDLTLYTATVGCWVDFWGSYRNGSRFVADPLLPAKGNSNSSRLDDNTLVLELGGNRVELKHGNVAMNVESKLSLGMWWRRNEQVNAEYYPHTNLHFAFWFTAWWNIGGGGAQGTASDIPLVVELEFNYIPFYAVSNSDCISNTKRAGWVQGQPNVTWYSLEGFLRLSDAAKHGVQWLNGCMWTLSAITCMLTLTWCVLAGPDAPLAADFGLISFSATLLFALPTVRIAYNARTATCCATRWYTV